MLRKEEYDILDELRKTGALPLELEQRHQKLRREQFFKAGLQADNYPPSTSSRLENTDMTISDWLQERWSSADSRVRQSLQVLADALSIDIPLTRTPPIPPKDSSPIRRTTYAPQPNVEQDTLDDLSRLGMDPEFRRDPPEWHDELSEGWEPAESLHDALHPEDRGWH